MKLVLLVLVLALGGLVGALMARDPGYVLLAYEQTAVETSLWFALLLLVLGYAVIWLVARLALQVIPGRGALRGWTARRRSRAAMLRAHRGHLLLAEQRWSEARKLLEEAAPHHAEPLLDQLGAARAAHEMGDFSARDEWLRKTAEATPDAELAAGLIQAELQQSAGQWEASVVTLLQLRQRAARHPRLLSLLVEGYRHLGQWEAVLELSSELDKRNVISGPASTGLQVEAWLGRLAAPGASASALWPQVPKAAKRQPALVLGFGRALAAEGRPGEAEALLRAALDQAWHPELLGCYGTLATDDPGAQRVAAEGWLRDRPNDPDLLLALGRISLKSRLWARAREYFETSLRLKATPEVQGELGRLCLALGDRERGAELLSQALHDLPALPQPDRERPAPSIAASATGVAANQRSLGA
jgi:HemY protein